MDGRAVFFALIALTTFQLLHAASVSDHAGSDYEESSPGSAPFESSVLEQEIQLSLDYLSDLKNSLIRIVKNEGDKISEMIQSITSECKKDMAEEEETVKDIIEETESMGYRYEPCLTGHKEPVLQAMTSADAQTKQCVAPLQDLHSKYISTLSSIQGGLAGDDSNAFKPCEPHSSSPTNQEIDGAVKCVQTVLKNAYHFYYPTARKLFNAIYEMEEAIARAQNAATACAKEAIVSTAQPVSDMFETLEKCAIAVNAQPQSRVKRGFGKKFKKFARKVKNGIKKVCNKIPCKYTYSTSFG